MTEGWSLRRLAWAYGCSKKGTAEEERLRFELLRRCAVELAGSLHAAGLARALAELEVEYPGFDESLTETPEEQHPFVRCAVAIVLELRARRRRRE